MPSFSITTEPQNGHIVTAAEVTANIVILRIHRAPTEGQFIRQLSGRAMAADLTHPLAYRFTFGIYHNQVFVPLCDEVYFTTKRLVWDGNAPMPKGSYVEVRVYGPLVAGDIIFAEGLMNG